MPPQLALILWAGFVAYLFWRDAKQPSHVSRALWIPLIWVLITGSRFVSQWLGIWGLLPGGAGAPEEGSPLDALVFLGLIALGFRVLQQRRIRLGLLMRENVWLSIFFIYCFLAIVWSDFPFIALKRWIKILGHPIMALVVLTDPDPDEAFRRLFKRASFLMITGSVLCIKYFPDIGRGFDPWTGQAFNQGINLNKNELGYVCLLTGLFFVWNFLQAGHYVEKKQRRYEQLLSLGFIAMIWWLLSMSDSATSLVCALVGVVMMLVLGWKWINKRFLGSYIVAFVLLFGIAETTLGVYENVLKALGRNATLTDRTEVWKDVLALTDDPVLGAGFESFWLGERREKMWAKWHWHPTQAHNGYIETYINLGAVGVILLIGLIIGTFKKIQRMLLWDFEFGRLRMGFLVAILLYNFTEAAFKGVSLVWLVWHMIALDYPRKETAEFGPGSSEEPESTPGELEANQDYHTA
jgi:O-antigen ligase